MMAVTSSPAKASGTSNLEEATSIRLPMPLLAATVSATMEKRIGGSGDPTFAEAISQGDWDRYCAAFA